MGRISQTFLFSVVIQIKLKITFVAIQFMIIGAEQATTLYGNIEWDVHML